MTEFQKSQAEALLTSLQKEETALALKTIAEMNLDEVSVISAELMFAYCHPEFPKALLTALPAEVKTMLESLKKVTELRFSNQEEEAENIRKMLFAISKDIRVIIIILAFVHAKMNFISEYPEGERLEYAKVALELYAPLANRLGINKIKSQIEDLAFCVTEPKTFNDICLALEEKIKQRSATLENAKARLLEMTKELGIEARVMGRKKHIYSIWKKLNWKKLTMETIYDLFAVRAIVKTVPECYQLLGKIYGEHTPIQNTFRDYISIPKSNGYQSLHTTVNFQGFPVEIQIRTEEMHRAAEYGVAAHWVYKEKRGKQDDLDAKLAWIRSLMDTEGFSKQDYIDALKVNIFAGEIFVQTPMGKVIHLPEKAIPIDFAYAVHSEVGNHCVGAKINGKMKTLTTELANGDMVEIITNPHSKGPSLDWMKIVKTVEARNKIRAFFRREMKEENIKTGRNMLEIGAKNAGYPLARLLDGGREQKLITKYYLDSIDEIYAGIGRGAIPVSTVCHFLTFELKKELAPQEALVKKSTNQQVRLKQNTSSVNVKDVDGLMINFAQCCSPVPGDEIIGYISYGRGVIVHRKNCSNLKGFEPVRLIDVEWNSGLKGDYLSTIQMEVQDKNYILQMIASKMTDFKINLKSFNTKALPNGRLHVSLQMVVQSKEEVKRLIEKLKQMDEVVEIFRS